MIFDSHAHYDSEQFDIDRDELLGSVLPQKGVVAVINMAADYESLKKTVALCEKYDYIYGALGIHPECANDLPDNWLSDVEALLSHPKIVAVGEIGLDYHWEDECPREKQKEVLIAQLELAKKHDLPVVIHDREAHGDMMDILRKYKPKGVVHCFSGSVELAQETVKLGMYIGLGGVVTFKNARHSVEVAKAIPLDRLLTETDAPYMAPVPFRGKRCDSSMIPYDAAKIAEVRGITAQEVLETAWRKRLPPFRYHAAERRKIKGAIILTITYEYGDNLYINVTNQCPNACDFCLRNNSTGSLYADNLWYEGAEPTKEEILADLKKRDLNSYAEIVFCGYGEPACRWDDMLWLGRALKRNGQLHPARQHKRPCGLHHRAQRCAGNARAFGHCVRQLKRADRRKVRCGMPLEIRPRGV